MTQTEFKQHYDRMRDKGMHRRAFWLDDDTMERLHALVGRYGRNQSEVIAEAVRHLHRQAKEQRP